MTLAPDAPEAAREVDAEVKGADAELERLASPVEATAPALAPELSHALLCAVRVNAMLVVSLFFLAAVGVLLWRRGVEVDGRGADRGGGDRVGSGRVDGGFVGGGCREGGLGRLIAFESLSVPANITDSNLTQSELIAQDKTAFNSIHLSQMLRRPLLGPFVTQTGHIVPLPPLTPPGAHPLTALYNESRLAIYFPSLCLATSSSHLRRLCTPRHTILACARTDGCPHSRFHRLSARALHVLRLPSADTRLAAFAYRSRSLQRAPCLLVSGYDIGGAAESAASLAYISAHRHPRPLGALFVPPAPAGAPLASTGALREARALFRREPWRAWKSPARPVHALFADAVGTPLDAAFALLHFPGTWAAPAAGCALAARADRLAHHVALAAGSRRLVVVRDGLLAPRELRDALAAPLARANVTLAVARVAPPNALVAQLLAQEAVSRAHVCLCVVTDAAGLRVRFVDVFRLERGLPPCRRVTFNVSNCSYGGGSDGPVAA